MFLVKRTGIPALNTYGKSFYGNTAQLQNVDENSNYWELLKYKVIHK